MKSRVTAPKAFRVATVLVVFFAGAIFGVFLARGPRSTFAQADVHRADAAGIKAPIAEVLHCPLAFVGVHLQKDQPTNAQTAYHFCKPLNESVAQCLLYDGTGADARLIGVEYLVNDEIFRAMPAEEQAYWHDHENEVDAGLLRSLTQHGDEEKATLAKVRTLHGKIFHTWVAGKTYPEGPPKLFWAITGKAPFLAPPGVKSAPQSK